MVCKHKYKPRYDREWTTVVEEIIKQGCSLERARGVEPYLKKETYRHDICVKCGDVKP